MYQTMSSILTTIMPCFGLGYADGKQKENIGTEMKWEQKLATILVRL